MHLDKSIINVARKQVEEMLSKVPEGQRIQLPNELLEQLLFDTVICKKETGETIKLPVWSGKFLRKLDLSKISFDNVSWSILSDVCYYEEKIDVDVFDSIFSDSQYDVKQQVDYSYTNAKIDFSKSWDAKYGGNIANCNFSGVDLSHNALNGEIYIFDCDFSNTGLRLSPSVFGKPYVDNDNLLHNVFLSN